ncbi:MAG: hypothetical protein Ct9H90mP16_15920 [Candidatus Poseidoniales archaeon]|nr:MAG: hypothetical protein Ct9H90mP16_15920 [Candidatus Poseidoniales archaeon]
MFAEQIFENKPKIVTNTNHPKVGGIASFHAALAIHALSGRIPNWPESHDAMLTDAFKAGPSENTVSVPIQHLHLGIHLGPELRDASDK